jgi:mannose-6-phosphate isomerase-like protein (cupin superfamily)
MKLIVLVSIAMWIASPQMTSPANAEHYTWGSGCDGWYLVKRDELTIIEERMPTGTSETMHRHTRSRQFFYVLAGEARMEHDGHVIVLRAGEGLEVPPGVNHRISNAAAQPLRVMVTSQPPSHDDRIESER